MDELPDRDNTNERQSRRAFSGNMALAGGALALSIVGVGVTAANDDSKSGSNRATWTF